jgi:hypothetical protein
MKWHAWFSKKMAQMNGTIFYRKPDGSEIEVTMVSRNRTTSSKLDDMVYLGEYDLIFVRQGQKVLNYLKELKV